MRSAAPALVVLLAAAGCVDRAGEGPVGALPTVERSVFEQGRIERVRVEMRPIGLAPNSGLHLPVVDPDGRRIAALHIPAGQMVAPRSLISGIGLGPVSLRLRDLDSDGGWRMICPSGVAWPQWSPDGRTLLYVVYRDGTCKLGLYGVAAERMRLVSPGPEHLMMPAMSPDGERAAVVVPDAVPNRTRLHVLDLSTGRLGDVPEREGVTWRLWPLWATDRQVVFLQRREGRAEWASWSPGDAETVVLGEVAAPADIGSAVQMLAGLPCPLNRRAWKLAWYRPSADAIAAIDVRDGSVCSCPEGTRAACWLGGERLLVARNDELLVCEVPSGESSVLLRGPWLPLWSDPGALEMILAAASEDPATFNLVRAKILDGVER